ncbi:hypothetical protein [Actinoplanes utahensis]
MELRRGGRVQHPHPGASDGIADLNEKVLPLLRVSGAIPSGYDDSTT